MLIKIVKDYAVAVGATETDIEGKKHFIYLGLCPTSSLKNRQRMRALIIPQI